MTRRGLALRILEGKRSWWIGRASNPAGGAMRCRVGSTPIPFRPHPFAHLDQLSRMSATFGPRCDDVPTARGGHRNGSAQCGDH